MANAANLEEGRINSAEAWDIVAKRVAAVDVNESNLDARSNCGPLRNRRHVRYCEIKCRHVVDIRDSDGDLLRVDATVSIRGLDRHLVDVVVIGIGRRL